MISPKLIFLCFGGAAFGFGIACALARADRQRVAEQRYLAREIADMEAEGGIVLR